MKFLREPLVHFLLIGAALFGIFAWAGKEAAERPDKIVIAPGMVENLKLSFERQSGHPPDEKELQEATDTYVREEILTREARKLRLDTDDPVVRYRLVQRMEFLSEDTMATQTPTDEVLQKYLQENPARFKTAEGRIPTLVEARVLVQRAWQEAQRKEAMRVAYEKMRERYKIVVEKP